MIYLKPISYKIKNKDEFLKQIQIVNTNMKFKNWFWFLKVETIFLNIILNKPNFYF